MPQEDNDQNEEFVGEPRFSRLGGITGGGDGPEFFGGKGGALSLAALRLGGLSGGIFDANFIFVLCKYNLP